MGALPPDPRKHLEPALALFLSKGGKIACLSLSETEKEGKCSEERNGAVHRYTTRMHSVLRYQTLQPEPEEKRETKNACS